MQTNFTIAQLADPDIAIADRILRSCVHCGFCTATCPTYLLLGDELDSPRGRIYLIKDMLERGQSADPRVVHHLDRCLTCLSCMTTCPSGVDYMHLLDHARAHIERTHRRPLRERLLRRFALGVLTRPLRMRLALLAARGLRPLAGVISRLGLPRLGAMLALAPGHLPWRSPMEGPATFAALGARRGRVALLSGCAQSVLAPGINEAAIRLLRRIGYDVVLPNGEGCCGSLRHHTGDPAGARAEATRLLRAWQRELDGDGLDAIIVTTSGCGTTIKDYPTLLRDDPTRVESARRVASITHDITEFVAKNELPPPVRRAGFVVAYHAACSLQHGQRVVDQPKALLQAAGFTLRDVPEGHICCGSAGLYNLLQPDLAGQLRERKLDNIAPLGAPIVAAGNIGCLTQIAAGLAARRLRPAVVHTVELLDWATGGPVPEAIARAGLVKRWHRSDLDD